MSADCSSTLDDMIERARDVRRHAYAPYSGYAVGVCLRSASGALFVCCNVENAAYPLSSCAEAGAVSALAAAGERQIVEVVVMGGRLGHQASLPARSDDSQLCTPCGGCRQRLAEFAGPDTKVHVCDPEGLRRTFSLGELLPHAFDATTLGGI